VGNDVLDTASLAMRHWRSGAADGDWSRLLGMMDPDVSFHVPVAGFMQPQRGADAATRFFDHLTAVLRAELVVTSTMHDDDRVGFEVAVRGTMRGREFRQALVLVFLIDGGRIQEFREYLAWPGGLDPE
jgi:ketosteroid isomerase-like protein